MKAQLGKYEHLVSWLERSEISVDAAERYLHIEGYFITWRTLGKYPLGIMQLLKSEEENLQRVTKLLNEHDWKKNWRALANMGVYPKRDEI